MDIGKTPTQAQQHSRPSTIASCLWSGEEEGGGRQKGDMEAFPGGGPENVGDMSTGDQMAQTRKAAGLEPSVPGSQVKGAPEPGEELVPQDINWEPGPDGSTCVNDEEPAAIVPDDVYVGRTNNMKWTAGPDGTNYDNIDYGVWLRKLKENKLSTFMNRLKLMEAIPHPTRQ